MCMYKRIDTMRAHFYTQRAIECVFPINQIPKIYANLFN